MKPRVIPLILTLAAAAAHADGPVNNQTGLKLAQKHHCQQRLMPFAHTHM